MASRYLWRSIVRKGQERGFVSSTTPKHAAAAAATDLHMGSTLKSRADHFPIYILFGFTGGAVFLAVRSVSQQLIHHPGVQVSKSKRSMVPEIDNPDASLAYGDNFIAKSVLRKVGHIQHHDNDITMDRTPNVTRSREAVTLKTVGATRG